MKERDTQGLPHAILITTADVKERTGAMLMFALHDEDMSEVSNVLVDGAYTGTRFEDMTAQILGTAVEVAKRNELREFAMIPKRWIVER